MKKQRHTPKSLLMAALLPALALLPGCDPNVTPEKQLVCVLPDGFLSEDDPRDYRYDYFLFNRLYVNGTRYAYIHALNDTLSVLKTNGMEVKGSFKKWKSYLFCKVIDASKPVRRPEPYIEAETDKSLTTFVFSDKHNKSHVYIDDRKADTTLYKSYIPVIRNGIASVDSSVYKLTKTTYRPEINLHNQPYLASKRKTSFYFKGHEGPDFRDIESEQVDLVNGNYRYVGICLDCGAPWGTGKIPVINGTAYWQYPLTFHGYISESRFGDLYFPFTDTVRNQQGYWINGNAVPARFDRAGSIAFYGKNDYEFVGLNETLATDSSTTYRTYYLVSNNRVSGPYTYGGLVDQSFTRHGESLLPAKKILFTHDSVFCYQENRLVYRDRFDSSESIYDAGFDFLEKAGKTILQIQSEGRKGSFFCINNTCFPQQTPLPSREDQEHDQKKLNQYLGASNDSTKYARIEYVYQEGKEDYDRLARLYVNDSLMGTFPYDVELFWDTKDDFVLKGRFGSWRNGFLSGSSSDSAAYRQFVTEHYPEGVPERLLKVRPQEDNIRTGFIEGKISYIFLNDRFEVLGEMIYTHNELTPKGVTDNGHFYHAFKNEPRIADVLFVDFRPVYTSPKILGIKDAQNYISFYSLEGNSLYLVTCNLNSWPARLQKFFRDLFT